MNDFEPRPDDKHLIARCRWSTTLDDQEQGYSLQEFLSEWSHTALGDEASKVFDQYCPDDETWRIDKLTLDLGTIDYADVKRDLPLRFKNSLHSMLRQIKARGADFERSLTPTRRVESIQEDIRRFLLAGMMPWWSRGHESNQSLLEKILKESTASFITILRELGRKEDVRKRVARQYREPLLREIVGLLEPDHQDTIFAFTDHLLDTHAKRKLVTVDQTSFRQYTWYWVFTHLLVERGSLFNTVQFVRSTIKQMSQHFAIDYSLLLQQVMDASEAITQSWHRKPAFIEALCHLKLEDDPAQNQSQSNATYFWHVFETAVKTGSKQASTDYGPVSLAELFMLLARQDSGRMAKLVLKLGRQHRARKTLVAQLNSPALELLIELVKPTQARFILAHIKRAEAAVTLNRGQADSTWEAAFAYLLVNSGSHFNRRQFVRDTLEAISQRQGGDYPELLVSMLYTPELQALGDGFGLSMILQELYNEHRVEGTGTVNQTDLHRQALMHYLETGEIIKRLDGHFMPEPKTLLKSQLGHPGGRLVKLKASLMKRGRSTPEVLARRLVELGGAAQFNLIVEALNNRAAAFVAGFVMLMKNTGQTGKRTSGVNERYALDVAIVEALFSGYQGSHPVSGFLDALTEVVTRRTGLKRQQWFGQLSACLEQVAPDRPVTDFAGWLNSQPPVSSPGASSADVAAPLQPDDRVTEDTAISSAALFILKNGRLPSWYESQEHVAAKTVVKRAMLNDADKFRQKVFAQRRDVRLMYRLHHLVEWDVLIKALKKGDPALAGDFDKLNALHECISLFDITNVSNETLQGIVHDKALICWTESTWNEKALGQITGAVIEHLLIQTGTDIQAVFDAFDAVEEHLPNECRQVIKNLVKPEAEQARNPIQLMQPAAPRLKTSTQAPQEGDNRVESGLSIKVNNAGLVLVQDFVRPYFSRLDLLKDDRFASQKAQRDAVHYLQYLVTGQAETEEQYLVLNKLLSGLPLTAPVEYGIEITREQRDLGDGLIAAMIDYWSAINGGSIDGFRGNWLVRNGTLLEQPDCWSLAVEKRPYDLLLQQAPFSYSMLKYPWMTKPLYVTWPV